MAWRSMRRFSTNAPYFDFHTGRRARGGAAVQLGAPVKKHWVAAGRSTTASGRRRRRNVPYNAAAFGAYRLERRRVAPLLCGVGAGVACAVATHPPMWWMRASRRRGRPSAAPPPLILPLEAALARDPGALIRGLVPRVCALAPGTWLFFAVFRPVRDRGVSYGTDRYRGAEDVSG